MEKQCVVCSKPFHVFKSTMRRKKYCSKDCREVITHIEAKCINCGEVFKVARSKYEGLHLKFKCCSTKCYDILSEKKKEEINNRHTYVCSACNKIFSGRRRGKTELKFCSQDCSRSYMRGDCSPSYRTGTTVVTQGYIAIKVGEKYILEHRLIMEEFLGRKLKPREVVHHKDGNKLNNNLDNLEVMDTAEHSKLHNKRRLYESAKQKTD